jgi:murein DD-endopeptidase MepM/ murein hydrolase activator NlpD
MRLLVQVTASLLLGASLLAQDLRVQVADDVLQGHTLRVEIQAESGTPTPDHWTAEFRDRKVKVYPDGPERWLALMPIDATGPVGTDALVIRSTDGKPLFKKDIRVKDARFRIQNIRATSGMKALKPLPGEMETIRALQETDSPHRHWSEPLVSPTPQCINSPFGVQRFHNGKPTGNYHRGIDHRSPQGTPVRATAGGVVKISKMYRLHGGTVGLDHGHGLSSIYIHLSKLAVKEGSIVERGDTIGFVGSTGFATGPHLHWGLYVNGLPVNPLQWVPDIKACK